jgi:signal transduction histidine kinase
MGNIVVVSNVETHTMVMANKALFRFLDMKDIEEFKTQYKCICDLFVAKEGFLQEENDGVYWIEYLQINHNKINKVLVPHDGKEYLYFVHGKFLDETHTTAITVFTNITDLKEMDDRIANDLKIEALSEMITNISHHWRQPLSLISTLASTILVNIEMDVDDKEQIVKSSENIIKTSQELSSILDIFSNKMDDNLNKKELITINDLIGLLESYFKEELENFSIELYVSSNNVVKNKVVSKMLFDVGREIIQNSIDILKSCSNEDEKTIFVNMSYENRELIFDIYDNGGGVSEKNLGKIFEPYFTTHYQSKGKGMGLYIAKNTIDNLIGGKIFAQNKQFKHNNNSFVGLETIIKVNM